MTAYDMTAQAMFPASPGKTLRSVLKTAGKWAAIAIWFELVGDFAGRLISSPLDALFALSPLTAWLDGVTWCVTN